MSVLTTLSEILGINNFVKASKVAIPTGENKFTTLDKFLKKQNIIFEKTLTSDSPTIVADGLDLIKDGMHYKFELIGASNTDSEIEIILNNINTYRSHIWGSYRTGGASGHTTTFGDYVLNSTSIAGYLMTVNSAVPFRIVGDIFKLSADSNLISYNSDYYYSNPYYTVLSKLSSHIDSDINLTKITIKQKNGGDFRAGTKLVIRKI